MDLKAKREERARLVAANRAMIDKAGKEGRDLTEPEASDFDKNSKRVDVLNADITRLERQQTDEAHLERIENHGLGGFAGSAAGRQRDDEGRGTALFRDTTGCVIRALGPTERVATREDQELSIGRCLQAHLTGNIDRLTPREIKALGSFSTGGGYLLTPEFGRVVIDLARSASVAIRAGAQTVGMDRAEMVLARLNSDPVAQWRHEGVPVQATDMTFGTLTLHPRTLAAVVPVPIELLEDSENVASVIDGALSAVMGLMLDKAALMGSGAAAEPRGITNTPNVNSIAAVGTPSDYSKVTEAVGDILAANYSGEPDGLAWILHPRDGETFDKLKDTTGQPLQPTPWASKLKRFSTTSLPTTGGGGTESTSIVGDFSQCLIGLRTNGVVVRVLDSGQVTDSNGYTHNAASELKRLIVAYLRADVAVLRPTWFTALTGITP